MSSFASRARTSSLAHELSLVHPSQTTHHALETSMTLEERLREENEDFQLRVCEMTKKLQALEVSKANKNTTLKETQKSDS